MAPSSAASASGTRCAVAEQAPTASRACRTTPPSSASTPPTMAMEMTRWMRAPSLRKPLFAPVGGRGVALDELGGGGRGGHDKVLDDVGAREGVVLVWVFFVLRRKRGPEREREGEK